MNALIRYISKHVTISDEMKVDILAIINERQLGKNDLLISQNQGSVSSTFFIKKGIIRSYFIDKKGKEHTLGFAKKHGWITDYMALYSDNVARLNIECVNESTVFEIKRKDIANLFKKYPLIETFHRKNIEKAIVMLNKRLLDQLHLSASERYFKFLESYTDIHNCIPNCYIASYLGITEQSLSRIRSNKKLTFGNF